MEWILPTISIILLILWIAYIARWIRQEKTESAEIYQRTKRIVCKSVKPESVAMEYKYHYYRDMLKDDKHYQVVITIHQLN